MPDRDRFTHAEERALAAVVRSDRPAECPRCAILLDARAVPPRPDVSYVRDRVWLVCPGCGRSAVVDRRPG